MKIITSTIIATDKIQKDGTYTYLLCIMNDGSQWRCTMAGENWIKINLSDGELTKKFNEQITS